MKSVLISINPKWCELIASGKKTVEVRKTKPKLDTPFKCYIYETLGKTKWCNTCKDDCERPYPNCACHEGWGKVIGEFVCDRVIGTCMWRLKGETGLCAKRTEEETNLPNNACLTLEEIEKYAGSRGRGIYGWHITDLVVYDEPRELSEFYTEGDCDCMNCKKCYWFDRGNGYNVENDCNLAYKCVELHKSFKPIIRPPQSWCYVESEDTE